MIEAYQKYDPSKAKFTSYAYPYILGEIKKTIRENKPLKVSKETNTLKNKIIKAKELLEQNLMHEPTTKEISEYLEIPESYIIEALNSNYFVSSIEQNIYDSNMMLEEIIGRTTDINSLIYLKKELEELEEPERTIMIGRYYNDLTQKEVGDFLGLSQVEVSRKEKKVLTKLRQYN